MHGPVRVLIDGSSTELGPSAPAILSLGRALASPHGADLVAHTAVAAEPSLTVEAGQYGARHIIAPNGELDAATMAATLTSDLAEGGILLAPSTPFGKDVAARTSARTNTPLLCDASGIEWRRGALSIIHPVYGGKASQRTVVDNGDAIITLTADSFTPDPVQSPAPAALTTLADVSTPATTGIEVLELAPTPPLDLDLDEVDVIVAGGMGLGGPQGFETLTELANLLGGRVGASRMVTDRGWISTDALVGQTGSVVAPGLYIACGISGAPQHVIGMRDSATIIAINTDPHAAIASVADVLYVADVHDLVPAIIDALLHPVEVAA